MGSLGLNLLWMTYEEFKSKIKNKKEAKTSNYFMGFIFGLLCGPFTLVAGIATLLVGTKHEQDTDT